MLLKKVPLPYSSTAILKDGTSIIIRSIRGSDENSLLELFNSLSDATVYSRYFAPSGARHAPNWHDIQPLCHPNPSRELTLVATVDEFGVTRVIGIGRCTSDTVRPFIASLTLAVHESWQGKGVGTLLVEHLAMLGERAGVMQFEGFVLSDNRKILEVLRKSGLRAIRDLDKGEAMVEFSTEETTDFRIASIDREMRATAKSLEPFFTPKSVAVVGASRRPGSIGQVLVSNLLEAGYKGKIYPVNPAASSIDGLKVYRSIESIPGSVDMALIAVHVQDVEETVAQCIRKKVKGVVIISSGFGEVSAEGREIERRITKMARAGGLRIVGPNCMGLLNTDPGNPLYAVFAGLFPPEGNIAMVSQSGGLGIAILDYVSAYNLGISNFVSIGNRADVSVNDLLSCWAFDDRTKVIALYIESFGNPEKFSRMAPQLARKKPIIAVKSGRTAAGARAASSHSASLANVDVAVDAIFEQTGVIRTNTLEEMFDVAKVLASQPLPAGPNVGVVTNAGGPGILLSDALEVRGLQMPSLAPGTIEQLKAILPFQAGLANPIDTLAYAGGDLYEKTIRLVGADENVDSLIVIFIPTVMADPKDVAAGIARGAAAIPSEKPVLTVFISSSEAVPAELHSGPRGKIPTFVFPENAAEALSSVERYARWRGKPDGEVLEPDGKMRTKVREIIDNVLAQNSAAQWLSAKNVSDLLQEVGIKIAPWETTPPDGGSEGVKEAASRVGYPVVLKAVSADVLHKSDAGGVVLAIQDEKELLEAVDSITEKMAAHEARLERFLIQREIEGGVEFLVGVTTDDLFGHLIVTGLGGVYVELFKDVAFSLPPVTDVDASEMLDKLRAKKLLEGFRGSPKVDKKALEDVIRRVSMLVELVPEIRELDLNPVKVLPEGEGAVAVDARIRVAAR